MTDAKPTAGVPEGALPFVGQTPLFVGLRYLLRKRLSYLAILGVALSVGTLIVVMSVMSGFAQHLQKVIRGYNSDLTIRRVGGSLYGMTRADYERASETALQNPHVRATAPFVLGPALARILPGEYMDHVFFRGIDPKREGAVSDFGAGFLTRPPGEAGPSPTLESLLTAQYRDQNGALLPNCIVGRVMGEGSPARQTMDLTLKLAAGDKAVGILSGLLESRLSPQAEAALTGAIQAVTTGLLREADAQRAAEEMRKAARDLSDAQKARLAQALSAVQSGLPEPERQRLLGLLYGVAGADSYDEAERRLDGLAALEGKGYPRACAFLKTQADNLLDYAVVLVTATGDARRRIRKFHVAGTFQTGRYDWDRQVVLLSLDDATSFIDSNGAVSGLSVGLKPGQYKEHAAEVVQDLRRRLDPGCVVLTWEQQESTFLEAVAMERFLMAVILSFVGVLAGFCIFAILTMTVYEKRRDIGILKAIGFTPIAIGEIFLFNGTAIGLSGGALGVAVGRLFCAHINQIAGVIERLTGWTPFPPNVYYFNEIPADMNWTTPLVVAGAAILCSLVFSLLPALKASRLDPVQTLRYE